MGTSLAEGQSAVGPGLRLSANKGSMEGLHQRGEEATADRHLLTRRAGGRALGSRGRMARAGTAVGSRAAMASVARDEAGMVTGHQGHGEGSRTSKGKWDRDEEEQRGRRGRDAPG